ncbi:hypothetical protein ABZP36_030329 [Zizania latifolia]
MEAAKVEVRFEDVRVEADVRAGRRRALPTLLNSTVNAAQDIAASLRVCTKRKEQVKIIGGVSGTIRSSRMTLVLGAPGSGKTTFLRALAGKLDPSLKVCYLHITSNNAFGIASFRIEINKHFDKIACNASLVLSAFFSSIVCYKKNTLRMLYLCKQILGLSECADTVIGDDLRRGISGGQKKRVTIGEMLVGITRCFFMDDISTGLDSSTTFEIMKFLQQTAHSMDITMVISLLQPTPETFELFDDIILLCEGKIVYHGPRENATDFFETIGFKCPIKKNVADFLQEVTSKMDQKQYWVDCGNKYQYYSIEEFAESFRTSDLHQLVENNHLMPTNAGTRKEVKENTSHRIYRSRWNIFKACFSREVLLVKRNSPVHIFKTIQITVLALVISTLFFRANMSQNTVLDANKYMRALFLSLVIVNFNGMTEIAMTIKRLPIFYKQREVLALPGWALLNSIFLISLPMSLVETGIWTSLTYYVIGYAPSPIRFIQHFVVLFAMHQMSMGLYRFLATIGRTQVMANMMATAALIAICILGGFFIPKDDLQPWLRWGYWTSPFTYAQNAVSLNEFLDKRWATEFHYANANTVGEAILRITGLLTEWHWYWICVSILFGFSLVFNILSIFALEFMSSPHKRQVNINHTKVKVEYKSQTVGNGSASTDQVILPFRPLSLVFHHINYFVDMPKDEQDVFNILGIMHGSALFLGFMNCSILQPVVAMERVVLYREKAAGMYSNMAYVIAQVSVELPYMFVQVFIFSAIVYPMIGFEMTASKFFWFALYMVLDFMYYTLFGMMTVALTPNIEIAAGLSFLIFIFWNVFSGFIIGREMIPVWWRWVYWVNPAAWTVYGLMFSQLGDQTELIHVPGQLDQMVQEFLEGYLGLQDDYFNLVTCLHLAVITLFALLFFLSIKYLKFQKR